MRHLPLLFAASLLACVPPGVVGDRGAMRFSDPDGERAISGLQIGPVATSAQLELVVEFLSPPPASVAVRTTGAISIARANLTGLPATVTLMATGVGTGRLEVYDPTTMEPFDSVDVVTARPAAVGSSVVHAAALVGQDVKVQVWSEDANGTRLLGRHGFVATVAGTPTTLTSANTGLVELPLDTRLAGLLPLELADGHSPKLWTDVLVVEASAVTRVDPHVLCCSEGSATSRIELTMPGGGRAATLLQPEAFAGERLILGGDAAVTMSVSPASVAVLSREKLFDAEVWLLRAIGAGDATLTLSAGTYTMDVPIVVTAAR